MWPWYSKSICIIVVWPIFISFVDAMTRMSNDLLPFEYNKEVEHVVAIATAVDKSWKWNSMQSFILTTPKKKEKFEWKREKEVFSSFFFVYYCCDHKKKTTLWMLFVNINRLKKKYSYSTIETFIWILLPIVKVEVPWWSCTTWNGLDLGFM